jgi:hypothetical protein
MTQNTDNAPQVRGASGGPVFAATRSREPAPQNLADVLERVLDKGIVVVGDIQVRLLDIELLTIKIRLMVASVDRAREMGISWWENDAFATGVEPSGGQQDELESRVRQLEQKLGEGEGQDGR